MVTSDSLNDVLDQMRLNTSPTTYNFQGRTIQFSGGQSEDPTISSDDVTWRNGTIQWVELQSFYVQSTGVVMEAITVNGGFEGVCVRGDGSLTMTDCEVHGAEYGLALSDTGTLEATTLKVKGCTESSFWLADTSYVVLTDCDIIAHDARFAISMHDLSKMTGKRVEIWGHHCNPVFDLHDDASLSFKSTTLQGIPILVADGKGGTEHRVLKLLSEDPTNYADAPREGIRRILEQVTGLPHPRDTPLSTSRIASIRMGTTVATNALLERRGERLALVVTQGFPDLLHIGNQGEGEACTGRDPGFPDPPHIGNRVRGEEGEGEACTGRDPGVPRPAAHRQSGEGGRKGEGEACTGRDLGFPDPPHIGNRGGRKGEGEACTGRDPGFPDPPHIGNRVRGRKGRERLAPVVTRGFPTRRTSAIGGSPTCRTSAIEVRGGGRGRERLAPGRDPGVPRPAAHRQSGGRKGEGEACTGRDPGVPDPPHIGNRVRGEEGEGEACTGRDPGFPDPPHIGNRVRGGGRGRERLAPVVTRGSPTRRTSAIGKGEGEACTGRDPGFPDLPHIGNRVRGRKGEGEACTGRDPGFPDPPHIGNRVRGEEGEGEACTGRDPGFPDPPHIGNRGGGRGRERLAPVVTRGFPDPPHIGNRVRGGRKGEGEACTGCDPGFPDPPHIGNRVRGRKGEGEACTGCDPGFPDPLHIGNRGFPDLLHIGNQSRPNIFDLKIQMPAALYETVVEVDECVVLPLGTSPNTRNGRNAHANVSSAADGPIVVTVTGEEVCIRRAPDMARLAADLQAVLRSGITALAVVLKHAAIFPDHELQVGRLAAEMGFTQVSLSSVVMPMVKMLPRGFTATADAYLTPHILRYLRTFQSGFDAGLCDVQLLFMQSDGGLADIHTFSGHKAILSGPAGGYVGYALTTHPWEGAEPPASQPLAGQDTATSGTPTTGPHAEPRSSCHSPQPGQPLQVIGFDMGGTSTDVSRYAGRLEHVFESTTAGVTIQAPQLDINTVARAKRLLFREGLFVIFGPTEDQALDSAGAASAVGVLTREINAYAAAHGGAPKSADEVAMGFLNVANEAMCRPIRALTQMKGYDVAAHVLACFGGAGGQHACAIARSLGMSTIFMHRYAGILSAVGIQLADIVAEEQEPCAETLDPASDPAAAAAAASGAVEERLARLQQKAVGKLLAQGFSAADIRCELFLNLRYQGTDVAVMTSLDQPPQTSDPPPAQASYDPASYISAFERQYQREFGFKLARPVLVDDLRVRATGESRSLEKTEGQAGTPGPLPTPLSCHMAYFEPHGRCPTPAYSLAALQPGHCVPGPAVLIDQISTLVVEPGCTAHITGENNVRISVGPLPTVAPKQTPLSSASPQGTSSSKQQQPSSDPETTPQAPTRLMSHPAPASSSQPSTAEAEPSTAETGASSASALPVCPAASSPSDVDPIRLAIFSHRFMGIAEQMGRTLQRTSISVNIKERLDFSCALFGPDGSLVANAPHLPVHLGAMSEAVRFQVRHYSPGGAGLAAGERGLSEGDVLVSNHPQLAGGSHLPDITVITPVFQQGQVVFFVASRGHHADIGGISPGSMPPRKQNLVGGGGGHRVVQAGAGGGVHDPHTPSTGQSSEPLQEAGITQLLMAPAALHDTIPGISGSRNISDNLSDLRAQVAANTRGIELVAELIRSYGLQEVQSYMGHIQDNAEAAVRAMLKSFSLSQGLPEVGSVTARDIMDDGSPIVLSVTIDRRDGSAHFDFTGTGPEVYGNCNAPPAVTTSAIIYSLRCMVGGDIPLNQGCLAPITITIPPSCLLNPSPTAAVVGGNVLTSQRVTDVVLKAFQAAAASQGCMNNFTFGDEGMGYYETIAGGAGAGPGWHGRSGVHTHMTNTRITDPEILERRFPVVLHQFRLRSGSGGAGQWHGGEGVIREIEALRPLDAGILSERRCVGPFGLQGGADGACGMNLLVRKDGHVVNLGGKATVRLEAGDRLRIMTPGAGGFGLARNGEGRRSGDQQPPDQQQQQRQTQTQQQQQQTLHQPKGSVFEYRSRQEGA
ncbi:MAG: hypothetical protein WDW38_006142 [Sanguina aurantia]